MSYIFTFIHLLSVFILISCLAIEYVLFSNKLTNQFILKLKRVDMAYGISAGIVLLSGLVRVFTEKGLSHYLSTPAFWVKLLCFFVIAGFSILPTIFFIKLPKGNNIDVDGTSYLKIRRFILLQLLILPIILGLAIYIARGFY